jgi:hypothetical protein
MREEDGNAADYENEIPTYVLAKPDFICYLMKHVCYMSRISMPQLGQNKGIAQVTDITKQRWAR